MAKKKKKPDPTPEEAEAPSFEGSLAELERIVHELEGGSLGLEESLVEFEKAVGLLRNCYAVLERAEQRIDVLTGFDAEGNPVATPFDGSATVESGQQTTTGRRKKRRTNDEDDDSTALF